jgi:seryl-tRNA synthetase
LLVEWNDHLADGSAVIPEVLRPYMGGVEVIEALES